MFQIQKPETPYHIMLCYAIIIYSVLVYYYIMLYIIIVIHYSVTGPRPLIVYYSTLYYINDSNSNNDNDNYY